MARKPPPEVAAVYAGYPAPARRRLLSLRDLILSTAESRQIGALDECLKWGEPAYLTTSSSGTTIRLAWSAKRPRQYGLYVNCQTDLIATWRDQFGGTFTYEGNRGLIFGLDETPPQDALKTSITAALTYHRRKKSSV